MTEVKVEDELKVEQKGNNKRKLILK